MSKQQNAQEVTEFEGLTSLSLWRYNKLEARRAELLSLTLHFVLRKLYTEPSTGASYQISVHLATPFQRRFFRNNQKIELPIMFVNRSGRNEQCL